MKKLDKLQINSEKILKDEELLTLRGGYGMGYCSCRDEHDVHLCWAYPINCDLCMDFCDSICPGATASICAG